MCTLVIFCHPLVHFGPFVDQDDDCQVAPHHHQEGQKPRHREDKYEVDQLLADFLYSINGTFLWNLQEFLSQMTQWLCTGGIQV